jgi:hypothetical protein
MGYNSYMISRVQHVVIVIVILVEIALIAIWAINGYKDTWYYATAMIIAIPTSWISFSKR